MYEDLIKRLRDSKHEIDCSLCDRDCCYPDGKVHGKCIIIEAADAIEELSKRLDESIPKGDAEIIIEELSKPRWIPVTERLPEPNAVDKYGFAKGYLVKTDRHVMMHTARYTGEWWVLWGKATVITDTVTHWMPLPEPPKEE